MTKEIVRIYVAGPLSASDPIGYLENVRRMVRVSVNLLNRGFVPFCPGIDLQYFLTRPEDVTISMKAIKHYSLKWLEVCDAVVLCPGWKTSKGTLAEIKLAEELSIPVFYSISEFYNAEKEKK